MAKINAARSVTQIPWRYPLQSFFDSTQLQTAILNQGKGSPIVESTKQSAQTPGVGVALHPASQSPVAIRFRGGLADSAEIILVPGQRLNVGAFESFDWGLPFGWLGGGNVLLFVLHRDDALADFPASNAAAVPFHRLRLPIGGAFPGTLTRNWPTAFPWTNAIYGADSTPQGGSPIMNITPTMTMLRLRSSLAAPTTLSFVWRGTDDLDTDSDGITVSTADLTETEVSFPSVPAGSGTFPIAWLPSEIAHLAGDAAALTVIDANAGNPLSGSFIDVVRYGVLS